VFGIGATIRWHDSVRYLKNALDDETDILHEYFVPRDQLVAFVDGCAAITTHKAIS